MSEGTHDVVAQTVMMALEALEQANQYRRDLARAVYERDALSTENRRLREALEKIARIDETGYAEQAGDNVAAMFKHIARAALSPAETE